GLDAGEADRSDRRRRDEAELLHDAAGAEAARLGERAGHRRAAHVEELDHVVAGAGSARPTGEAGDAADAGEVEREVAEAVLHAELAARVRLNHEAGAEVE